MRAKRFLLGSFFILMLGYAVPGYAPPPGSCTPWPECKNDGGSDPPAAPADNNTEAQWSGPVYEGGLRPCNLGFLQTNGKGGHYQCDPTVQPIFFGFASPGTTIDKKGREIDPDPLCDMTPVPNLTPNTKYAYSWGDDGGGDCTTDSGCNVRAVAWFYQVGGFQPVGTGLIILEGFGNVANTCNVNPFAECVSSPSPGPIPMGAVLITFKQEGTNKALATCRWSEPDGNLPTAPEFISVPDVP